MINTKWFIVNRICIFCNSLRLGNASYFDVAFMLMLTRMKYNFYDGFNLCYFSREFRYFNDVHAFDVVNETWSKVKDTGFTKPDPRSACQMICTQDPTKVLVYGGFSKKDIDSGKTHTDMYVLNLVAPPSSEDEYKCSWSQLRSTGESVPANRCGFTMTSIPLNRAICFGGVNDQVCLEVGGGGYGRGQYQLDFFSLGVGGGFIENKTKITIHNNNIYNL